MRKDWDWVELQPHRHEPAAVVLEGRKEAGRQPLVRMCIRESFVGEKMWIYDAVMVFYDWSCTYISSA